MRRARHTAPFSPQPSRWCEYHLPDSCNHNLYSDTYDPYLGYLADTTTKDQNQNIIAETKQSYEFGQIYASADPQKYTKITTQQMVSSGVWYSTVSYQDAEGREVYSDTYGTHAPGSGAKLGDQNVYANYNFLTETKGATVCATQYSASYTDQTYTTTSGTVSGTEKYNGLGQQTQSASGTDPASAYAYDEAGRVIKTSTPFSKDTLQTVYKNDLTYYDAGGRVIRQKSQNNSAATPPGYTPGVFYSSVYLTYAVSEYAYDNMGRKTMEKSCGESAGRTVLSTSGGTPTDSSPQITQYCYDAKGQLVRVYSGMNQPLSITGLDQYTNPSPSNNPVHVVKYGYDYYGNRTSYTDAGGSTTTYTYNELTGWLLSKTLPNGNVISYTYDNKGNVTKVTGTKPGSPTLTMTYVYNVGGQLTSATDTTGLTRYYYYDDYGNVSWVHYNSSGVDYDVYYDYDQKGNVLEEAFQAWDNYQNYMVAYYYQYNSYDQNSRQTYSYAGDNSTANSIYYSYDASGNLTSIDYPSVSLSMTYNYAGLMETEKLTKGSAQVMSASYLYQLDGSTVQKDTVDPDGDKTADQYSYDAWGRLTKEETLKSGASYAVSTYSYDSWNNLTQILRKSNYMKNAYGWNLTAQAGQYSYDSTAAYSYDAANRMQTQFIKDNVTVTVWNMAFTYDAAGNELSKTKNGATQQTFTYDALNRVASFTNAAGQVTNYQYDAFGHRTGKSGANSLTSVWSGDMIIADLGASTRYYLNGPTGNVGMFLNGSFVPRIADSKGTTVLGLNGANATPSGIYTFDAYGNRLDGNGSLTATGNPYTYDGYYQDYESGLYYLNARYYDPTTQQFTQEDPAQDGNNWYGYCGGNPILNSDPSGCSASSYSGQSLKKGSSGAAVMLVQAALNNFFSYFKDFTPLVMDGKFGPLTEAAVKRFQRMCSDLDGVQLVADGKVGPKTWGALFDFPEPESYYQRNPISDGGDGGGDSGGTAVSDGGALSGIIHDGEGITDSIPGIDTAAIGAFFLDMWQDNYGVYHASQNCWQQIFGYNSLYDAVFALGTSMDKAIFPFTSGGTDYMIEAWKGDYVNLGAGAEMGIYQRQTILGFNTNHWAVNKSLAMSMSLVLRYNGHAIISYSPNEKQWWITGFNPRYKNVSKNNLTAVYTVRFNSKQMYNDFYNIYGTGKYKDSRWLFSGNLTATFTF